MNNEKYITVSELTKYIKELIDGDFFLNNVYLRGEISNFKAHTRGHFYFTLKDENSRINAVMFMGNASKLKFTPTDGMKVLVTGRISVYETTGGYQIYVNEMLEDGLGNLYIAFEQLKKKLEEEGLFKAEHKKRIPKIPETIGIVTAPTGAAIKDILSTIKRRWPIAKTILFPSLVQGEEAAADIVRNIELAHNYDIDVLIVGRGGGSIEDLWPFNEEIVARAIYNSKIPIISAVGHEIDFTISDFVADLRAPTPTGAAELAVPNIVDVTNYLSQIDIRLNKVISHKISFNQEILNRLKNSYVLTNPMSIYQIKEQNFDNLLERLNLNILAIIKNNGDRLNNLKNNYILKNPKVLYESKEKEYKYLLNKLEILNPLLTIKRGYSITKTKDKIVRSIKDVKKDDKISVEVTDGVIDAIVI